MSRNRILDVVSIVLITLIVVLVMHALCVHAHGQDRRVVEQTQRNRKLMLGISSYSSCLDLHEAEAQAEIMMSPQWRRLIGYTSSVRLHPCGIGVTLPEHTTRRACIGFTASWCDDTYTERDIYEIWTTGMRKIWRDQLWEYGLDPVAMARNWPFTNPPKFKPVPERWPYTLCLGFTGRVCDESYPLLDTCESINKCVQDRDHPFDVLLSAKVVLCSSEPLILYNNERLIGVGNRVGGGRVYNPYPNWDIGR